MRISILIIVLVLTLVLTGCRSNDSSVTSFNNTVETPAAGSMIEGGELFQGILFESFDAAAFDKDNVLWLAGEEGITAIYQNKFQIFDRYNTNWLHARFNQVLVDDQNRKWFANIWGEVFTFDDHKWEMMPMPKKVEGITAMRKAEGGTIWVIGNAETTGGSSEGILWSYKDYKVDRTFPSSQFGAKYFTGLAIDSNNVVYVSTQENGIYRYDGSTWCKPDYKLPTLYISKLYFNPNNNVLYCLISKGYIGENRSYVEAGIFALTDQGAESLNPEGKPLTDAQYSNLREDNAGNLWLGLAVNARPGEIPLSSLDGKKWFPYGQGTPFEGRWIKKIITDNQGRYWVWGRKSSEKRDYLAMLEGDTWTAFRCIDEDPRIWWRKPGLAELYKLTVDSTDILEVQKNPVPFRGKKLRILCNIESSFEYVNLVDLQGNKLNIWPEYHLELNTFMQAHPLEKRESAPSSDRYKVNVSGPYEFIGFLEFSGGYGHMGGWPYNFYIAEAYPYSTVESENEAAHRDFADYILSSGNDNQQIREVLNQWISAMKSGDIEGLKNIYHPDVAAYRVLSYKGVKEQLKANPMDITINDMVLVIQGDTARMNIRDASVKPDKYFTPTGNVRIKGDGLYVLRSISFKKYGADWKLSEFDYSPDYELPALLPPVKASLTTVPVPTSASQPAIITPTQ